MVPGPERPVGAGGQGPSGPSERGAQGPSGLSEREIAPLLGSAEIGRTIQSQEITALPLVERNVFTLLDLTPGVQSNNNGVATASTGTSTFILGYPEQRTLINGGTDGGTGSVTTIWMAAST